jgi:hypothetical protein
MEDIRDIQINIYRNQWSEKPYLLSSISLISITMIVFAIICCYDTRFENTVGTQQQDEFTCTLHIQGVADCLGEEYHLKSLVYVTIYTSESFTTLM